jgi:hypothetical protein
MFGTVNSADDRLLLSLLNPDGTLDLASALKRLDKDEEELINDDFSILDCTQHDGSFNLLKFFGRKEEPSLLEMSLLHEADIVDNSNTPHPNKVILSRHKKCMLYQLWVGEHMVQATPLESPWYLMYVKCPMINVPKFHTQFHQRFRIPYAQFIQFVSDAKENDWFPRRSKWNTTSPLELLILGGFRYIGQGWTFDDLEGSTMISSKVHWNYFHQFIDVGSKILYPLCVTTPLMQDDMSSHMHCMSIILLDFQAALAPQMLLMWLLKV